VYISDSSGFKIYAISKKITLIAGPNANVGKFYPAQLAVDEHNHLFICDKSYHRVLQMDLGTGEIKIFAGTGAGDFSGDGGPAIAAHLNRPGGIAVDAAGNVYIADSGNGRLRKVDVAGNINTIAGRDYGYFMDGSDAAKSSLNPQMLYISSKEEIFVGDAIIFAGTPINVRLRKVFLP
jgi:DNA-binding beta-propeller fold protein YncE